MGVAVSSIAFPAPIMPISYYEENLSCRSDLIWLTTSALEKIPAIYRRYGKKTHRSPKDGKIQRRPTILYSHGNAEDIALHLPFVDKLCETTRCDVLSYEYVGYSLSGLIDGCRPSEEGCIRSINAAWRYLVDTERIPPSYIILQGCSIGTGPTVDLASRSKVSETYASPLDAGGVLLQSPLESGLRVAYGTTASTIGYQFDIFRNYEKIDKIEAPVAIVHGEDDVVVPCANGKALHEKLQNPFEPYWISGEGHNGIPEEDICQYAKKFADSTIKKTALAEKRTYPNSICAGTKDILLSKIKNKVGQKTK
mmetsp:Transcript_9951/g.13932  ORF Transcript_9951/g.13932 Transcript_9951/m.13932 type:complete len:310 (-) Transcript_9951:183-1112(-)|eukprot:CAMPEP_0185737348 /NCGR_PEP_ID=MMETSP1171-20130828/30176_1 /TAXON_ID=374046 /ORGANISM="Helicotheca tamensis, Strain CCMP826" /LENGTH=309 /DNA_ID=CAMNT_0028408249 /DNA_START=31 /DNA_END=960 /DNA_ORIENTATION=-